QEAPAAKERGRPRDKAEKSAPAALAKTVTKARPAAPPLADLERRKVRQIASGKTAIDARIDLHGARQGDARSRLRGFLFDAHARGCGTVPVITGKGGSGETDRLAPLMGEAQRGVLRRSVPVWLAEPDLRAIVLGYTEAGTRHGGAGALYV